MATSNVTQFPVGSPPLADVAPGIITTMLPPLDEAIGRVNSLKRVTQMLQAEDDLDEVERAVFEHIIVSLDDIYQLLQQAEMQVAGMRRGS